MKKSMHEEIAKVAYQHYEEKGSVHGNDLRDWFGAEKIVMDKHEKHAHEIEKGVEPVSKPSRGYRRTVKKEGFYKKG